MPKQKAAFKALRQAQAHYLRNQKIRKTIKDLRKKSDKAISAGKLEEATKLYQTLQKTVDKAAKSGGFLKPNTAARYKSQIGKKVRALTKQ